MNEGALTVKAGTYRNPETGSPRRGRLTGRWLPLSAGTTEGGREGGLAWTRRISPLHQGLFRMIGGEGLACHMGVAFHPVFYAVFMKHCNRCFQDINAFYFTGFREPHGKRDAITAHTAPQIQHADIPACFKTGI